MFKILLSNCCGLDVHKTWILACIGITDNNNNCSVNVGCKCTDNLRPARCIVPCIIVHQISHAPGKQKCLPGFFLPYRHT